MAMASGGLKCVWSLVGLAVVVVSVGCPSTTPPGSAEGSGSGKQVVEQKGKDDLAAVAALEAAKATLEKDSEGRVIVVDLDSAKGSDADLAHLKGLPYVRELSAVEVRGVTDAGLASLAGHPNLRTLKLERSSVGDAGMVHLQKIPKLEDLDVRRTGVTAAGYREVGKIAGLKRLRVVYNARFNDEACEAIKDLRNLELIDMQDCNQPTEKGLAVLQGFPKLRNVRLWGPNINDKVLSYLSGAKDLRALSLEQCSAVSGEGLSHVTKMKSLTELALYGATGLKDAEMAKLAEMPKLVALDLRQTPISSLALTYLKDMKGLKSLDLSETALVGNEGLEHIKGLTNLEDLNLWSCNIDDKGLVNLKGMTKLKRLNLDKCLITDEGLKELVPLTNLEFLHIGSTQVTDAGLEHLHGMKNLKKLVVTYLPGVSAEGVDKLMEKLPGLEEVEQ
jgi:Leucine-rich repeat (LRR) protein